jgi:hypothetical protein
MMPPSCILFQDGQIEIEQTLHLQPSTVQKLKKFINEERTIYDSFRRYMDRYVGEYRWVPKLITVCE